MRYALIAAPPWIGANALQSVDKPPNRTERRKQRTRAALITAAQGLIADGTLHVPIQDICEAADVGVGSFYNHFESKEQLFDAAIDAALDAHGALLDALTASIDDPAAVFAFSFRLTGRMFRRPESRMVLNHGLELITAERGLAPRARRDIAAAAASGRFQVADPKLAMAVAAGALLGLGQLIQAEPERDAAQTADQVTRDLLRMFGLSADEAHELCSEPMELDGLESAGELDQRVTG
ncbi:TetR/AcrR family transcriptional regulator [Mycobacterium paragordonae]|uniref:TetR/AcrR family transcriptional regulator n=1 Tax=Mycobacterium paragordonae TaxID=1389713 RepID=A0A4R5WVF1_9MYCO|nr:TetR/AcrR family transcriptional regulator [Mycobacterium paragordonae]MDP7736929.1 TetR/AcrR family transcriptional regulator [Mycobacterium paragordonae]TDK98684.1 TetR/AcrR family transcriptional regulator [Mycobacterium paragordonae]TDL09007.1 TetR/AcrR family transcriptional regulator [Mycobacterium paragordonae]